MTGIGLSLGEVGAEDTDSSLRVVGIVLGSPAQLAGVKQVVIYIAGVQYIFNFLSVYF